MAGPKVSVYLMMVCFMVLCAGARAEQGDVAADIWQQETLTGDFLGLRDSLSSNGIEAGLSSTHIYQQNVRGGLSTHRRAGRYSGSYDLDIDIDAAKVFGFEGGSFHILTEGKWSKSQGVDPPSVGSFFNVNGDAAPRRTMDVTELWYQQSFAADTLQVRIGKMDITGGFEHHNCPVAFDCSMYANDENTQFLNGSLINNPTIPFPEYGLGIAVYYGPDDFWYISGAVVDAQADVRETGFNTAFHGEDYFFYLLETGITPLLGSGKGALPGAYRIGLWYDPQPKANTDLADAGKEYRDDLGFYTTCGQMVAKENDDPEDSQGLGVFFRYGYANSERNDLTAFVSAGVQYEGLVDGRDSDILGAGFSHGTFSDKASASYTDDYEGAFEAYYSAEIAPWFIVSPNVQYVVNPGGNSAVADAVVLGVRTLVVF